MSRMVLVGAAAAVLSGVPERHTPDTFLHESYVYCAIQLCTVQLYRTTAESQPARR